MASASGSAGATSDLRGALHSLKDKYTVVDKYAAFMVGLWMLVDVVRGMGLCALFGWWGFVIGGVSVCVGWLCGVVMGESRSNSPRTLGLVIRTRHPASPRLLAPLCTFSLLQVLASGANNQRATDARGARRKEPPVRN